MPVEFRYPFNKTSILNIQIPDGYSISELPKNFKIMLSDSSSTFTCISINDKNLIQIKSTFMADRIFYPVEMYSELREFYANISKFFSGQIVIAKN
jgi:hypothetical protein